MDRTESRFWSKVQKTDTCWNWLASCDRVGYGHLSVKGRLTAAHRYAYQLANGPIPAGMVVMHTCDNRKCVRLEHLRLGTQADNIADMVTKRRQRNGIVTGEAHGNTTLTADQVEEIRSLLGKESGRSLARRFGVSPSTVSRIHLKQSWPEPGH